MTDLIMYDDVTLSLIPKGAVAVALYTNGRFANWTQGVIDFAKAKHLAINVTAGVNGDGLDCEPGDVPPLAFDIIAGWIKRQLPRKDKNVAKPVVYVSLSSAQAVVNGLAARGLRYGVDYFLWTAHYTFRQHRCSPVCGFGFREVAHLTQFTDRANGVSLDASLVEELVFGSPESPIPPDPYRIFSSDGLACRDIRTSKRVVLNEKATVQAFDKQIVHPESNPKATVDLWFDIAALRNRVWHQAQTFKDDKGKLPSWDSNNRGARFLELDHRSHGIG